MQTTSEHWIELYTMWETAAGLGRGTDFLYNGNNRRSPGAGV